jgi:general secretion pathway protein M
MIYSLSQWQRRAFALVILGVLVFTTLFGIILPLIYIYREDWDSIDESRRLIAGYHRLGASRPALAAQLDELRRRESTRGFLQGKEPTLVAATLQSDLKRVIVTNGGEIRSSQILPVVDESGFPKVGIRLDLAANAASLQKILFQVEVSEPALFIDNVDIRAPESLRMEAAGAEAPYVVRFDVIGYMEGAPS